MRSLSGASLTGVAMLTLGIVASSGCAKVGQLQAMKAFKAANQAYQQQDYKKSAGLYEDTVAADPNLAQAYFFLGNTPRADFRPIVREVMAKAPYCKTWVQFQPDPDGVLEGAVHVKQFAKDIARKRPWDRIRF